MATSAGAGLLARQLKQLKQDTSLIGISADLVDNNVFEWEVVIMFNDEHEFYPDAIFNARLSFTEEYPHMPPKMKFVSEVYHPNVYNDSGKKGEVCISILHPPGEDKYGSEDASERWTPVQGPTTIILSVVSMLSAPNGDSPANIDAGILFRNDKKAFKRETKRCARKSTDEC